VATAINNQLLTLDHEIRQTELRLRVAQNRRRRARLSLIFGPVLGVLLYALWWLPGISRTILVAVYIPAIPTAFAFCVASYYLNRHPGTPVVGENGRTYLSEGALELQLARQRDTRKQVLAQENVPIKVRRMVYRADAYVDIEQFRQESRGYRRASNILQGIVIIGSLAATGASGTATVLSNVRWVVLGITFLVGIASGFTGYFKYKERSFYLQQTADAIENEWYAFDIGVGRYKRFKDNEEEALAEFVDEVHRLKSEQKKREQNLEQPPEAKNPSE
jgi:Protein of unknown function (DUF4231)